MSFKVTIGGVFVALALFGHVFAEDGLLHVFHFPQMHHVPGLEGNAMFTKAVALSQFNIAKEILRRPHAEVFMESLYNDFTPESFEAFSQNPLSMVNAAKLIFDRGLPDHFNDLNETQMKFLTEISAPQVLFYLGLLKRVRASISQADSAAVDEKVASYREKYQSAFEMMIQFDEDLKKIVFDFREKKAVERVLQVAQAENLSEAIIVYGAAHDFEPHFKGSKGLAFLRESKLNPKDVVPIHSVNLKPLTIQSLRSRSEISEALLYYGNIDFSRRDESEKRLIIAEQEKIIELVEGSGLRLAAWEWQHLVIPDLKKYALKLLDPQSIDEAFFSIESFKNILAGGPDLKIAGEQWLDQKGLTTSGKKLSEAHDFIESLDKKISSARRLRLVLAGALSPTHRA